MGEKIINIEGLDRVEVVTQLADTARQQTMTPLRMLDPNSSQLQHLQEMTPDDIREKVAKIFLYEENKKSETVLFHHFPALRLGIKVTRNEVDVSEFCQYYGTDAADDTINELIKKRDEQKSVGGSEDKKVEGRRTAPSHEFKYSGKEIQKAVSMNRGLLCGR